MTTRAPAKARRLTGAPPIRLGINIDHVATLRNARGGRYPDPLRAAKLAVEAGADNITAHLREDRRHIRDEDIARLTAAKLAPLNLEMAVTDEMLQIALKVKPHASCLVPERRQEITTEGGLDVAGQIETLTPFVAKLRRAGIQVSLFIDPEPEQIEASAKVGTDAIEFHTGTYCRAATAGDRGASERELERLADGARQAAQRLASRSMPDTGSIMIMSLRSPRFPRSLSSISVITSWARPSSSVLPRASRACAQ